MASRLSAAQGSSKMDAKNNKKVAFHKRNDKIVSHTQYYHAPPKITQLMIKGEG